MTRRTRIVRNLPDGRRHHDREPKAKSYRCRVQLRHRSLTFELSEAVMKTTSLCWSGYAFRAAAARPAIRPYTMQVGMEFEPKRLEPWMPPVTSPAAYSFGIGLPNTSITSVFALMRKPPMQKCTAGHWATA